MYLFSHCTCGFAFTCNRFNGTPAQFLHALTTNSFSRTQITFLPESHSSLAAHASCRATSTVTAHRCGPFRRRAEAEHSPNEEAQPGPAQQGLPPQRPPQLGPDSAPRAGWGTGRGGAGPAAPHLSGAAPLRWTPRAATPHRQAAAKRPSAAPLTCGCRWAGEPRRAPRGATTSSASASARPRSARRGSEPRPRGTSVLQRPLAARRSLGPEGAWWPMTEVWMPREEMSISGSIGALRLRCNDSRARQCSRRWSETAFQYDQCHSVAFPSVPFLPARSWCPMTKRCLLQRPPGPFPQLPLGPCDARPGAPTGTSHWNSQPRHGHGLPGTARINALRNKGFFGKRVHGNNSTVLYPHNTVGLASTWKTGPGRHLAEN